MRSQQVRILFFLFLFIITGSIGYAQKEREKDKDTKKDTTPDNVLLEKQWSLGLILHTNGFGLKLRKGHNAKALRQFMWELEFATYKSAKEVRTINPYFTDSKSYIYGKLNYLYFLRGGVGSQHILTRKPYWGGIQLSALYYGGISVGITKPVYLYIVHFTGTGNEMTYEVQLERYNPDIHYIDNIYGRGSFLSGILNLKFYPGIYVRGGLDFEFGTRYKSIKSLEVGAVLDFSPIPIPVMAYNSPQNFFMTLYLSFSLGKRLN
jgi:hypothetical protein